jgi:hypothetical protein
MRKSERTPFREVFDALKGVLAKYADSLSVTEDTSTKYCLEAEVGPATLQAWGGKVRRHRIPVAWVEVGKSYVSYHLMGVSVPPVQAGISKALRARMQGKTCFNFTVTEPDVINELDAVTGASIAAFKKAGFAA